MKKAASTIVAEAMRIGGRSPAFLWMWDNYDELQAAASVGRTNWKVVAQRFAETDIGREKGYNSDALRMTWRRVVAQKKRAARTVAPLQQSAAQPRDGIFSESHVVNEEDFSEIDRALGILK